MPAIETHFEQSKIHFLKGLDHLENGRWISAEVEFKASLVSFPDRPSTLSNLAASLIRQEKWEEARIHLTRALQLDATHAPSWLNQGLIAAARQDFMGALANYDHALALEPDYPEALSNKGLALSELGRYQEACCCLDRALMLDPENSEFWSNRAVSLAEQGQFEAAFRDHAKAIALAPQDAGVHYNQALLLLHLKQFEAGFEAYEWRWMLDRFSSLPMKTSVAPWRGPGHGNQVLLWSEQGLGDEILYASMVDLLQGIDVNFALSADARLVPALQRGLQGIQVISHAQAHQMLAQGAFDAQAPTGSLGRLLRLDENKLKTRSVPYLRVDFQRMKSIGQQLATLGPGPVCGLSWRSKNQLIGAGKSIALSQWVDLIRTPGWSFVNLQYGEVSDEMHALQQNEGVLLGQIEGLDLYSDMEGLLALIQACDRIITSSNVTAHLAGALGKKALVLVPHGKSKIWYWHDDDSSSLWYPSVQLIHQNRPDSWGIELRQAAEWLTSG